MAQIDDLDYKAGAVINLVLSISDVIAIEAIIKAVAQKAMMRTAVVVVEEAAGNGAAHLSTNGAKLGQHLRQLEKYGKGGFKELANGRFRYYGEVTLNRGNVNSFRMVRE